MSHKSDKRKTRSAYALSTLSVSLVLFLVGTMGYLMLNAAQAADSVLDKMKASVILLDGTEKAELDKLTAGLKSKAYVSKVEYISKEQAAKNFQEFLGEEVIVDLGENPLPASLEVFLNKEVSTEEAIAQLQLDVKGNPAVEEVLYSRGFVEQVLTNISKFNLLLIVFGAIFLFVSVVLINNTIRMAVLSKRFLIKTMLLVGATYGFVRRPFLLQAFLQGIWATLIATFMLALLIIGLKRSIPDVSIIYEAWQSLIVIPAGLLVLGVVICLSSTFVSVNRYMRSSNDNLYVY